MASPDPPSGFWKPLDSVAEWVQYKVSTRVQQRICVLAIATSLPLMVWGPFSGEQFLIYEMSAWALTLTGLGWLAGLQATRAVEDTVEEGDD